MRTQSIVTGFGSPLLIAALLSMAGCQVKTPDTVAYTSATSVVRQTNEKPNIVVILADRLGFGDLGCYGQPHIPTPNIDRLAEQGCRFTQAYAGGDSAQATLWTLMTGLYSAAAVQEGRLLFEINSAQNTLPQTMRTSEYGTGFVGSWNLGGEGEAPSELYGFEEWSGLLAPPSDETLFPATIWRNGEQVAVSENAEGKRGADLVEVLTNEALAFLDRHRTGNPCLLVVRYPLPGDGLALPTTGAFADQDWTDQQKQRADGVARFDHAVGRFVEHLEELGLSEQTVVLVTSDCAAKTDELDEDKFASNGGLRTAGTTLYEGRLRVPLVVRWPAEINPGSATEFAVAPWDLMPTFAAMAGATLSSGVSNGVSFLPALLGDARPRRSMMYWETRDGGFGQGVRIGDWKAVRPCGKMERDAVELYNLREDPLETNNQAQEHPEILARFIKG